MAAAAAPVGKAPVEAGEEFQEGGGRQASGRADPPQLPLMADVRLTEDVRRRMTALRTRVNRSKKTSEDQLKELWNTRQMSLLLGVEAEGAYKNVYWSRAVGGAAAYVNWERRFVRLVREDARTRMELAASEHAARYCIAAFTMLEAEYMRLSSKVVPRKVSRHMIAQAVKDVRLIGVSDARIADMERSGLLVYCARARDTLKDFATFEAAQGALYDTDPLGAFLAQTQDIADEFYRNGSLALEDGGAEEVKHAGHLSVSPGSKARTTQQTPAVFHFSVEWVP